MKARITNRVHHVVICEQCKQDFDHFAANTNKRKKFCDRCVAKRHNDMKRKKYKAKELK